MAAATVGIWSSGRFSRTRTLTMICEMFEVGGELGQRLPAAMKYVQQKKRGEQAVAVVERPVKRCGRTVRRPVPRGGQHLLQDVLSRQPRAAF